MPEATARNRGWDYLGYERKEHSLYLLLDSWVVRESCEEHRLIELVLVFTSVINNSFCKAPAVSHLSFQQGWLPQCSSRSNGKEKVLEAAAEEPELQFLLSEQHSSGMCWGHWGKMISLPVWSETTLHSIMIFMAPKNKITSRTEFQVI